MTAADFLSHLSQVSPYGSDSWQAICPAHSDNRPSLKVTQAEDRLLIHCWAGCKTRDVLAALGLEWDALFEGEPLPVHERRILKDLRTEKKQRETEAWWVQSGYLKESATTGKSGP